MGCVGVLTAPAMSSAWSSDEAPRGFYLPPHASTAVIAGSFLMLMAPGVILTLLGTNCAKGSARLSIIPPTGVARLLVFYHAGLLQPSVNAETLTPKIHKRLQRAASR